MGALSESLLQRGIHAQYFQEMMKVESVRRAMAEEDLDQGTSVTDQCFKAQRYPVPVL